VKQIVYLYTNALLTAWEVYNCVRTTYLLFYAYSVITHIVLNYTCVQLYVRM